MGDEPPILGYARPGCVSWWDVEVARLRVLAAWAWKWSKRLIRVAAVAALVLLGRWGIRKQAIRTLEGRCAHYSAPADQVVYWYCPGRAGQLLGKHPGYHATPGTNPSLPDEVYLRPGCWGRYMALVGEEYPEEPWAPVWPREVLTPEAIFFLRELTTGGGTRRIVAVEYDSVHGALLVSVVELKGWAIQPEVRQWTMAGAYANAGASLELLRRLCGRDVQVLAGQIAADDPAGFVIPIRWGEERVSIKGCLMDDGKVRLWFVEGTGPAQSLQLVPVRLGPLPACDRVSSSMPRT